MKRRSCSLGFKVVFMIIFIMYFMQSCSSDTVISDDLFCMTVMTKSNDFIEPELTHKDSILVDSITKLDEFKSYVYKRQIICYGYPAIDKKNSAFNGIRFMG